MHDYRFYTSIENINGDIVSLFDSEFKHCCRVLRHKTGDKIHVFDGSGRLYLARINNICKNQVDAKILETTEPEKRTRLKIHLAVGLVKSKAMDLIIDQATALGIHSFYPLQTEHSIKKNFNHQRYQKKALEAVKQSGGLFLPRIYDVMSYQEWLEKMTGIEKKLIGYQHADTPLKAISFEPDSEIAVVIGPEGGFAVTEIEMADKAGFHSINLYAGRLRTELAVITVLAGLQLLTGGK